MSRPLNVVATSSLLLMMSRLLNDVATLISLQADVATASDAVLISRPLNVVTTSCLFYSSIPGCLTWSFCRAQLVLPSITLLLRLEFCRRDLDMNFHCCQGFTTSGLLILMRLSCCIVSSASYISNVHPPSALSTAKIPLSLEFPAA